LEPGVPALDVDPFDGVELIGYPLLCFELIEFFDSKPLDTGGHFMDSAAFPDLDIDPFEGKFLLDDHLLCFEAFGEYAMDIDFFDFEEVFGVDALDIPFFDFEEKDSHFED